MRDRSVSRVVRVVRVVCLVLAVALLGAPGPAAAVITDSGNVVCADPGTGLDPCTIGATGVGSRTNDGVAESHDFTIIGDAAGATGSLLVLNGGSHATVNGFSLGFNGGTGSATFGSGGTGSVGFLVVGDFRGDGSLTIAGAGAQVQVSQFTVLGRGITGPATGSVTIASGGTLVTGPGGLGLGENPAGSGTLLVTGAGSLLDMASAPGDLLVGRQGPGSVMVETGGQIMLSPTKGIDVGEVAGSTGTLTVAGPGSALLGVGGLNVGDRGQGTLSVAGGGTVAANSMDVGFRDGGAGAASVSGAGSAVTIAGAVRIGVFDPATLPTSGSLTIADGATVTAGGSPIAVQIGRFASNSGTVLVTGAGSQLTATGSLSIGVAGTGRLTVSDGAQASAGSTVVGSAAGGDGTLVVTGPGAQYQGGSVVRLGLNQSLDPADPHGAATVSVGRGATLLGTSILAGPGAVVGGDGTLAGPVTVQGGRVAPGGSPGTLSLTGTLDMTGAAGGVLEIEIGGLTPGFHDLLAVNGNVSLTSGTLELRFVGGFAPRANESVSFLTATGTLVFSGVTVVVSGLAPGFVLDVEVQGNALRAVARTDTQPLAPVRTVSHAPDGAPANDASGAPVVSADGRYVVFSSRATNLVAAGCTTATTPQVYRADRLTDRTECVSQTAAGAPGDGPSGDPVVSADGRFVAYPTLAQNLAPGCASAVQQIVRTDMVTRTTVCVSQGPAGPGAAPSRQPTISGDGHRIAFVAADGLDPACANDVDQILLRDVAAGTTRCVSVDAAGQAGTGPSFDPVLSQDGTTLAFATQATNLLFGPGAAAATAAGPRAAGGRGLVEPLSQVVQKSTAVGASLTTLLSQGPGGALGTGSSAKPALAANGQTVAFQSSAPNLVPECASGVSQVFVAGPAGLQCASRNESGAAGDAPSTDPALSGDGLVLVWASLAQNLTRGLTGPAGLPQILRTNLGLQNAVVELLSQAGGTGGNGASAKPSLDFAGQVTVFQTSATNLAAGDTNARDDVLLVLVAFAPPGTPDRVRITSPANGSAFPLTAPTLLTLTWTPRDGAAQYALEFTGADRVFANPNGTGPDGVNGFGGAGGVVVVAEPRLEVTLGPGFPAGLYQVRVVPLTADFQLLGRFSDAVTLALGAVPPGNGRVAITQPPGGTVLTPGQRVTFLWGALPGVASYFFEFTGPDGQFANPNGAGPDPANTGGGGLIVASTGFETTVPALAPGVYQVRVIGRTAAGAFVGTFSDAVAVTIP
jgi:T5SS/PEP-CTERM-associated repeat protein